MSSEDTCELASLLTDIKLLHLVPHEDWDQRLRSVAALQSLRVIQDQSMFIITGSFLTLKQDRFLPPASQGL